MTVATEEEKLGLRDRWVQLQRFSTLSFCFGSALSVFTNVHSDNFVLDLKTNARDHHNSSCSLHRYHRLYRRLSCFPRNYM